MILLNETTFKNLFDEYYEILCNMAYRYLYDSDASEDVVQEVFVHLWQKRKDIEIRSSMKSYLFSSVKNKSIEKIRRLKIEERYRDEIKFKDRIEEDFSDDNAEKLILVNKLYNSIEKLPTKCKAIFKRAKVEGMTYNEIAEELNLSVKTIESQMRRAFILLREMLK